MKDSSLEEWFLLHGWIDANSSFVYSSDSAKGHWAHKLAYQ